MTVPDEIVLDGQEHPCSYLEGRTARLPLRLQMEFLDGATVDASLADGDRRIGAMLYRTQCPSCASCEPIRIPVRDFRLSRSLRRVVQKNQDVRVVVGPVQVDAARVELFNRHRHLRGLADPGRHFDAEDYAAWFQQTCLPTVEMAYFVEETLIGVGILDVGEQDTSSVYFFFDPEHEARSPGTLSVIQEINWLAQRGGRYHYLGFYIADCKPMLYKARFYPHERKLDGRWQRFLRAPAGGNK